MNHLDVFASIESHLRPGDEEETDVAAEIMMMEKDYVFNFLSRNIKRRTKDQAQQCYEKYLHRLKFFQRFEKSHAVQIILVCLLRYSIEGVPFITQGDRPDGVYILLEGTAEVILKRSPNEEAVPNEVKPMEALQVEARRNRAATEKRRGSRLDEVTIEALRRIEQDNNRYQHNAVAELEEGDAFGEMGLMTEGATRNATVRYRASGGVEASAIFIPTADYYNLVYVHDQKERAKSHACVLRSDICEVLNWDRDKLEEFCKYLLPQKFKPNEDMPIMDPATGVLRMIFVSRGQVLLQNIDAASSDNGRKFVMHSGNIICKEAALPTEEARREAKTILQRDRYTAITGVQAFTMNHETVHQSLPEAMKVDLVRYVTMNSTQRREMMEANFAMKSRYSSSMGVEPIVAEKRVSLSPHHSVSLPLLVGKAKFKGRRTRRRNRR